MKKLLFLLLLLSSSSVFAAGEPQWCWNYNNLQCFSSAAAACADSGGGSFVSGGGWNGSVGHCDGGRGAQIWFSDGKCPEGQVLDTKGGSCKTPSKCESLAGSKVSCAVSLEGTGSDLGGVNAFNGCSTNAPSYACYPRGNNISECFLNATYTGQDAPADALNINCGTDPDPEPIPPPEPDPEPEPDKCPPGFSWDGSTCIADTLKPPVEGGGEGEGGNPEGGGENPEGGEGNNPEGGEGNNPEGGNTGGGTGGNNSGTGTGKDPEGTGKDPEGTGKDPEGEDGESSASGIDCNSSINCKGDAVQCSQLKKQKEIHCDGKKLYELKGDARTELDSLVSSKTEKIDGFGGVPAPKKNIGDMISKGASWLPKSCPAPNTVTYKGTQLSFSYEPICGIATDISGLIVALFSFLAIRIFGK